VSPPPFQRPRRVLVVDDSPDIHNLFRKMLLPEGAADPQLASLENELFGPQPTAPEPSPRLDLRIDSAMQGEDAVTMVADAVAADDPYFLAFVDVRMPPGIDGIATIRRLWPVAPDLYTVICTAYSDYSWEAISRELGHSPNLLILRKPFESIEVRQIVSTVARMYDALAAMQINLEHLQGAMAELEGAAIASQARTSAACAHAADAVLFLSPDGLLVEAYARHASLAPLVSAAKGAHVRDLLPGFELPEGGGRRAARVDGPGGVPVEIAAHPLGRGPGDPEGLMLLCHVTTP
jgi:CheY-like chemotaxis protein